PCDCEQLVQQVTGQPFTATPEVLQPMALGQLVRRLLTNLKTAYLRQGDFGRAARVSGRLCQIAPDDPAERRDLGVCLLQSGQPGRAIDSLAGYLASAPTGPEAQRVEQLLRQARVEVARWN